ncbi:hypothetical protein SAMN05444166_3328 [Singulisphaera sp. GP187]|nr:hypothetical protein SAMN05444166_3328 [Singulisphaera sp. GP187]
MRPPLESGLPWIAPAIPIARPGIQPSEDGALGDSVGESNAADQATPCCLNQASIRFQPSSALSLR